MMRIRILLAGALPILAACGAGSGVAGVAGSGSGGNGPKIIEPAGPVVEYSGNRQPTNIDKNNAVAVVREALHVHEASIFIENFWVEKPGNVARTYGYVITSSNGGRSEYTGELDEQLNGWLEIVFTDFVENETTFNGRVIHRYRTGRDSNYFGPFTNAGTGFAEYDNFRIARDNSDFTYHGIVQVSGAERERMDIDFIITNNDVGESIYLENCVIDFSLIGTDPGRPALRLSGTVNNSSAGSITVESSLPFPEMVISESTGFRVASGGGEMRITGADSHLDLHSLSGKFVGLAIDNDNDGVTDEGLRLSWQELAGIPEDYPPLATGPIANAGKYREAGVGHRTALNGLFSHDDDNDWLSFDWRIITKPLASNVEIATPSAPVIYFAPDSQGDYVFGLKATDGIRTSETAIAVRAVPAGEFDNDALALPGTLEVIPPRSVGQAITIDGRSSVYSSDQGASAHWSVTSSSTTTLLDTGDPLIRQLVVDNPDVVSVRLGHAEIALGIDTDLFQAQIEVLAGGNAEQLMVVDFNQDGMQDIAMRVTGTETGLQLLTATAPGRFDLGPVMATGYGEFAAGDLNGDQLIDFAVGDVGGILVSFQNPDGTFADAALVEFGDIGCASTTGAGDIAIGDVNGDQRDDLIVAEGCTRTLFVFLQHADGTLSGPTGQEEPGNVRGMASGDLNGDGRADAAFQIRPPTTARDDEIVFAYGQPDGSLQIQSRMVLTGSAPYISVLDANSDGRDDVVLGYRDVIEIFEQQPDGSLLLTTTWDGNPVSGDSYVDIMAGDIDDDGDTDLLMCRGGRIISVGVRNAVGSYDPFHALDCVSEFSSEDNTLAVIDFNGDGRNDILSTANRGISSSTRILFKVFLGGVHYYSTPPSE